jgi:4-hydroxy-tetrahydrodipicolinate synthase
MLAGATGFTSGAVNLCPRLVLALHEALANKKYVEAMSLQRTILPIENFRARCRESYSISMLKYGMQVAGHDFGSVRPPQRQLTPEERQEIEHLLKPILEREASLSAR